MGQYIDKDAVVAEIERRIEEVSQIEKASYEIGLCDAYKTILSFLDTLEVKEVEEEPVSSDIEAEFDNYANGILACDIQFEPFTHLHNCAKHFYELGLKAKSK